jgi:hypothetical protein
MYKALGSIPNTTPQQNNNTHYTCCTEPWVQTPVLPPPPKKKKTINMYVASQTTIRQGLSILRCGTFGGWLGHRGCTLICGIDAHLWHLFPSSSLPPFLPISFSPSPYASYWISQLPELCGNKFLFITNISGIIFRYYYISKMDLTHVNRF